MMNDINPSETTQDKSDWLKSSYEKDGILALRKSFEDKFRNFYGEMGYQESAPLPLLSDQDKSVIYTGASISALKGVLLSGEFPENSSGVFVSQECIRTGAKSKMFDKNWVPFGQVYFQMISTLSLPGRFDDVFNEAMDFTRNIVGVDKSRIKILSSKGLKQMNDLERLTELPIEYDTRGEDFYKWKYGIDGVSGEGLTIAVYNSQICEWMEVGNIVIIYKDDTDEIGIEFGYGYEYFLTAVLQLDNPLRISKIFEVFEFESGKMLKYYYNLEAVANMKMAGAKIGSFRSSYIYRRYLKSLLYNGHLVGKTAEDILSDLSVYMRELGPKELELMEESQLFEIHNRRKQDFKYLVNRIRLYLIKKERGKTPKETKLNPIKAIKQYLDKNGLEVEEVEESLAVLKRFNIVEELKL